MEKRIKCQSQLVDTIQSFYKVEEIFIFKNNAKNSFFSESMDNTYTY